MIGFLLIVLIYAWILMGKTSRPMKITVCVAIVATCLHFLTTNGELDRYELVDLLFSF